MRARRAIVAAIAKSSWVRTLLDLVDNSTADSLFHYRRFARCCSNPCDRARNGLSQPYRVVLVGPGIVARLGAGVLQTFEARPRILVKRESLGAVITGRIRPIERTLALAPVEADQSAIRAGPPHHPVLVNIAAA